MKSKRTIFIIFLLVLTVILFILLVIKTFFQKPTASQPTSLSPVSTPSASPKASTNNPIVITQNQEEKITVEYFPVTSIFDVTVEAQTVKEYIDKRQKAVELLKNSGIDPCDIKVEWPIPPNIKNDFTTDDLTQLHQITCPSRTLTPPVKH